MSNALPERLERSDSFRGNQTLKKSGQTIEWTREQLQEFVKCSTDPVYFCKYLKIVQVDKGIITFEPYEYQKKILMSYYERRYTCVAASRQTGKTSAICAAIIHYILFNDNKVVIVLANKGATSKEILRRIKLAYENLPKWLQQGVSEWNKESFFLENGSSVFAGTTTSDSVRGRSASLILVDEVAFIENFEEFYTSTYPTLSSGEETKLFLISSVNGMNHFYKFWKDAVSGKSDFHPIEVSWRDVPSRDHAWYERELRNIGSLRKFQQEHENAFLGSSLTLLPPEVLSILTSETPLSTDSDGFLRVYEKPIEGHLYILVADPSEGVGNDASAISVIDISSTPFKQVAAFSDNSQNTIQFSNIIDQLARTYNLAYVMVESNNFAGGQITQILDNDLEYPMLLRTTPSSKGMTFGISGPMVGLRTNQATKGLGCAMIKILIEKGILQVVDEETISEFTTFVVSSTSKKGYEAQKGSHDDLVMTLVIFAWMADQPFFKDLTNENIRATIRGDYANGGGYDIRSAGLVMMNSAPVDDFGWKHLDQQDSYDEHLETIKWMMGR